MADFTEILIRRGVIGEGQLKEALQTSKGKGINVTDALIDLGYATGEEVMMAVAEEHDLEFIDLAEQTIPPAVVELVPESVARENVILPYAESDDALKVIAHDPLDLDTFDKLRFIPESQSRYRTSAKVLNSRGNQPLLRADRR